MRRKLFYIFFIIIILISSGVIIIGNKNGDTGSIGLTDTSADSDQTDTAILKKNTKTDTKSDKPKIKVTFIELGSVNCIPCRMMQPVMEEIKKEYAGQVKVLFYDVWTSVGKPYGKFYGIRVIPTQIFLDETGKEFHRHTGFYAFDEIKKVFEKMGIK